MLNIAYNSTNKQVLPKVSDITLDEASFNVFRNLPIDQDQLRFLAYVTSRTSFNFDDNNTTSFVDIHWRTLRSTFTPTYKDCIIKPLKSLGLIEVNDSYIADNLGKQLGKDTHTKGYRLTYDFLLTLHKATYVQLCKKQYVRYLNLLTGKQVRIRRNHTTESDLQNQATKCYQPLVVTNFKAIIDNALSLTENPYKKLNILNAAIALRLDGSYSVSKDILTASPKYREGKTGRLFNGFQVLPRAIQAQLIPDNVTNYDIESSQLNILIEQKQLLGQSTIELENLLSIDKSTVAAELGITKELFKTCLYALIFGAKLPTVKFHPCNSINRAIYDYDNENYTAIAQSVTTYFAPIVSEMDEYRKSITNSVNILGLTCQSSDRKAIASHMLQGIEGCFIAHIVLLSEVYDYSVYANWHDGLWVRGSIPEEAIAEARRSSGFLSANFVQKSIL